ncbi:MAG: type I-U CRISPR-associated protein Csx17 [Burkholderiales bacterium]
MSRANNEVVLEGCTPTPLANYLKALGVLRLLTARDSNLKAAWRSEAFVLRTTLSREELEQFFLRDYQPTPVMAPWNGGSGFYEKDNKDALQAICAGRASRLAPYRESLSVAEGLLADADRSASPKEEAKRALLTSVRGVLPEAALAWFDASILMSGDDPRYPPLLGTGGNDGRLDFTNNFMQRLLDLIDPESGEPSPESRGWLRAALFGEAEPGLVNNAIGQFSPGQAGGPNASAGFEAVAAMNPWDFVLMLEGALLFAAASVRRNADDPAGVLSYPFTVRSVGAGAGNIGGADASASRGELWMPLWGRFASHAELRALLSEGRVALGKLPARDALDFVRAVHRLGSYRGICSFQRYGLLMRSGKAFLATPLERIDVSDEPRPSVLDDLAHDEWLSRFRWFAQGENTARRFLALRERLETATFRLAGRDPTPAEAQSVLVLLGEIQTALSNSKKARETVPPVQRLSERWVRLADDGTPAFRIARALAGLEGMPASPLPLRAQLFPVHPRVHHWMEEARNAKNAARDDTALRLRLHSGLHGRLPDALATILSRRLWLAEQFGMPDRPLQSPAGAGLDDVQAFLRDDAMDQRIASLLPGLCQCEIPRDAEHKTGEGATPAAFSLLKLCLTPDTTLRRLDLLGVDEHLRLAAGLLAQLVAGNAGNRAVESAWRRLRASGMSPVFDIHALPRLDGSDPRRVAAALLVPLRFAATGALARAVLRKDAPALDTA